MAAAAFHARPPCAGERVPARTLRSLPCRKAGGVQIQEVRILPFVLCATRGEDRSTPAG